MLNQHFEIIAVFDFTRLCWAVPDAFSSLKSLKKQSFIELTGQDFSQPINCRARYGGVAIGTDQITPFSSRRTVETAASLARDKFAMSLSLLPNRTRHIPGQLASGSIVAMTRAPSLSFRPSQASSCLPKQCPDLAGRRNGPGGRAGACISGPR
jgi:hypothetical protein